MSLIVYILPVDEPWGSLKVKVSTRDFVKTEELLSNLRAYSVLHERRINNIPIKAPAMAAVNSNSKSLSRGSEESVKVYARRLEDAGVTICKICHQIGHVTDNHRDRRSFTNKGADI